MTALDHNGRRRSAFSNVTNDSLNPQRLDFEINEWGWFTVQVFDSNISRELSHAFTYVLSTHMGKTNVKMNAFQGSLFFDYALN